MTAGRSCSRRATAPACPETDPPRSAARPVSTTAPRAMARTGFTLIELLVALAIFGVVAALSVRALASAIDQRAHLEEDNRRWRELDRLLATIEIDVARALGAPAAFTGRHEPAERDGIFLAILRAGHAYAGEQPVPPQAIVYRWEEGHVERSVYASLGAGAREGVLLASIYPARVLRLSLRYASAHGEWLPSWDAAEGELPRALELALELDDGGRIHRVFSVR